ncbi:MAG TPA: HPr family phosphocarrier protein [Actinomycetota bacterium]|jgi:phosphotransferase system HPr (HPr) family protein|nr:HPr family phosphocarrier protein [Actinomycetota bacterium]
MSQSCERSVILPVDLHARPAGAFSQAAARFDSTVLISAGDKEVDARSVLMVMSLGATAGTEVTVKADGSDAEGAVTALTEMLAATAA